MGRFDPFSLVIAVDFDGTLTKSNNTQDCLEIREEVRKPLTFLAYYGAHLVLWTSRTGSMLEEAKEFLKDQNLSWVFRYYNEPARALPFEVSRKIYADYYLDDLAPHWRHDDWDFVMSKILRDQFFEKVYALDYAQAYRAYLYYKETNLEF